MNDGLTLYIKEINKVPDLSEKEELELVNHVLDDDTKAAEKLAEANLKRAVIIAQEYWEKHNKKIDLWDLIQDGNTGLLRAVHIYTPAQSYRFWDYAEWWVRKEIEEGLQKRF